MFVNNEDKFFMKDRFSPDGPYLFYGLSCLFVPFMLFLYYFGSFYWFFESSSLAANIRFIIVSLLVVGVFDILFKIKKYRGGYEYYFNILLGFVFLFFLYASLNSIFLLGDFKLTRRSLVLLGFVCVVGFSFLTVKGWEFLLKGIAFIAFFFALLSLINMYRLDSLPAGYRDGGIYMSGIKGVADFGNTIVAAMHYAIGFTSAAYFFFTERSKFRLFLWVFVLFVLSFYIAFTFSRTGWVACIVSFFVMAFLLFDRSKVKRWVVAFVFLFFCAFVFLIKYMMYEISERGLTHRDDVWIAVISRVKGSWVFGHGASADIAPIPLLEGEVFVNNTHNVYLEVYYKLGAVGVFLFSIVLLCSVFYLYKNRNVAGYGRISIFWLSVLISSAVVMAVELNELIHTPNLLWHWFWMPVAFAIFIERKRLQDAK